jgi:hypothetical protein
MNQHAKSPQRLKLNASTMLLKYFIKPLYFITHKVIYIQNTRIEVLFKKATDFPAHGCNSSIDTIYQQTIATTFCYITNNLPC